MLDRAKWVDFEYQARNGRHTRKKLEQEWSRKTAGPNGERATLLRAIDEIKLRRMIAENEVAGTQQSDQQVNAAIAAVPPASGALMNHLATAVNRWQEYRRKLEALAIAWRN